MTDDELREAVQRVIELGYTVGANKDTYGEVTAILRALVERAEAAAIAATVNELLYDIPREGDYRDTYLLHERAAAIRARSK